MPHQGERFFRIKVLIVDDELHSPTSTGKAVQTLVEELEARYVFCLK